MLTLIKKQQKKKKTSKMSNKIYKITVTYSNCEVFFTSVSTTNKLIELIDQLDNDNTVISIKITHIKK